MGNKLVGCFRCGAKHEVEVSSIADVETDETDSTA